MEAVHWGEAPDLKVFWRKEVWRGKGSLGGVLSHGLRLDELPSLAYPIYMGSFGVLVALGAVVDGWHGYLRWLPLAMTLLTLPALMLALQTAYRAASLRTIPQLFVLYALYGWARAYALVRA
jgi:hypothetical protein